VLVDRGLVLRVIEPAEAEAIMAMYAEMEALFDAAPEGGSA
jgi:hydrogenase maturation factor